MEPTKPASEDAGVQPDQSDSDEVLSDVETRRMLLTSLAMNDARAFLTEERGHSESEALWLALRAVAAELIKTGVTVINLEERVATGELADKVNGAMVTGLLGLERHNPDNEHEDDADVRAFTQRVRDTGAAIRAGAGLTGVGA
jgi:hypothetical protein